MEGGLAMISSNGPSRQRTLAWMKKLHSEPMSNTSIGTSDGFGPTGEASPVA